MPKKPDISVHIVKDDLLQILITNTTVEGLRIAVTWAAAINDYDNEILYA